MRILVTGSQGTLGRVLVRELRRRGNQVFGCDLMHSEDPQVIRADISDARQLQQVFNKIGPLPPDVVYHLAAEFGRNNGHDYFEQLWRTNQIGTRNVIDACIYRDAKLILAGSSEAYGESSTYNESGEMPLVEEALDKHAPTFHNEYALSKWAQERQVFIAAQSRGLKAVVLRFFNAYGPGEFYSPYRSVVCLFCYRLLFGIPIDVYKDYHRVFMYVDDWARTVANVAERFEGLDATNAMHRLSKVPVFNVGGDEYRSVEDMAELVIKEIQSRGVVGKSMKINYRTKEFANVVNKRPDISLAKKHLGHDLRIKLEEGIPRTIEWMLKTYDQNGLLRGQETAESVSA